MKIVELQKVSEDKIGRLDKNNAKLEELEEKTFSYLTLFGFNVEVIRATSAKGVSNPDILIAGSVWEVKTLITNNVNTVKKRFREASKQSTKIIIDLRFVKKSADMVEKQLITQFKGNGRVRRLMIIEKSGKILDIFK